MWSWCVVKHPIKPTFKPLINPSTVEYSVEPSAVEHPFHSATDGKEINTVAFEPNVDLITGDRRTDQSAVELFVNPTGVRHLGDRPSYETSTKIRLRSKECLIAKGLEYTRSSLLSNHSAIHNRITRLGEEIKNMIITKSVKGIKNWWKKL